jgi:hypothetical protein
MLVECVYDNAKPKSPAKKETLEIVLDEETFQRDFKIVQSVLGTGESAFMLALFMMDFAASGRKVTLEYAVTFSHTDMVLQFLDRGTDIRALVDDAICGAAEYSNIETVTLLLDRGANVNAENGEPLYRAAANNRIETIEMLLDRGADIHAGEDAAIRWAARYGHKETVLRLIVRGANIHVFAKEEILEDGITVLELIESEGYEEVILLLLTYGLAIKALHMKIPRTHKRVPVNMIKTRQKQAALCYEQL